MAQIKLKDFRIVLIFTTVFIYLLGFGIVFPMIPSLGKSFGADSATIGILLSVYTAMQFLFSPFWGRLSDKYGRRPILLICLFGEAVSYLLFGFARNLNFLFLARILGGFFGGSISTASAYISDITPPQQRAKGMAVIGAAFGLGFLLGPMLGGMLLWWGSEISAEPHYSTSFTSFWIAGLCLVSFLFALKFLKESLNEHSAQTSGALKQIFLYGIKPVIGPLLAIFFFSALSMSTTEASLILMVGERFHWGMAQISFCFAFTGLVSVVTQGLIYPRLTDFWEERKILLLGVCLMPLAFGFIIYSQHEAGLFAALTLIALGTSFTNPTTLGLISALSGASEQGSVIGVAQGAAALGRIVGPAIGGLTYKYNPNGPFFLSTLFILCGGLVAFRIFSKLSLNSKV